VSEDSLEGIGPRALAVEQARLARFFETINKHQSAHGWLCRHGVELR
jgi:hypothetical protein